MIKFIKKFWWLVFPILLIWILFLVGRYGSNFNLNLFASFSKLSNLAEYSFSEDINKAVSSWVSLNSKWSNIIWPSGGDIKEFYTFARFMVQWFICFQTCINIIWGYIALIFVTFGNIIVDIFTFIWFLLDFIFNPIIQ